MVEMTLEQAALHLADGHPGGKECLLLDCSGIDPSTGELLSCRSDTPASDYGRTSTSTMTVNELDESTGSCLPGLWSSSAMISPLTTSISSALVANVKTVGKLVQGKTCGNLAAANKETAT